MSWFYVDVLSQINEKVYSVPDGGELKGSDDLLGELDDAQMLFTWNLKPLFEASGSDESALDDSGTNPPVPNNPSGGEGSAPQSPGTGSPADIPPYPSVESSQQPQNGMLLLTTSDSMEKVAQFYKSEFVSLGWLDLSQPNNATSDMIQLIFNKGTKMTFVMISTMDGKTSIAITQVGG